MLLLYYFRIGKYYLTNNRANYFLIFSRRIDDYIVMYFKFIHIEHLFPFFVYEILWKNVMVYFFIIDF